MCASIDLGRNLKNSNFWTCIERIVSYLDIIQAEKLRDGGSII